MIRIALKENTLDQQLFDQLYRVSDGLGYDTYVNLPDSQATYPFVVIGEMQIVPRKTSTRLLGKAFATIHVWGLNRKQVSIIAEDLLVSTRFIQLSTRKLNQAVNASDKLILEDTSTNASLMHGIVSIEFNIN